MTIFAFLSFPWPTTDICGESWQVKLLILGVLHVVGQPLERIACHTK
jgi:hypothetical protein